MTQNVILTITGPSLTGKTTLANELMDRFDIFETVVTHTTRPARKGEVDGVHYNFVTKEAFKSLLSQNGFIEHAEVGPKDHKEFYGASKKGLEVVFAKNKNPLFVIEPEGAANLQKFAQENNYKILQIFLNNDRDVLLERLFDRFKGDSLATSANYTKRLINMLDVEPKKWIEPALNKTQHYDLIVEIFNNNNDLVIENIMQEFKKIQQCEKKRKPR